jgi:uncharacterized protein (TIGR03437 family)
VDPPGRGWRAEEIVDGALPTSLEGVSVLVDGKPAAISFVGPGQINIQIPDIAPTGRVPIRVSGPTGVSESEAVVQSVAPALFIARIGSQSVLVALHADGTLVGRPEDMPGATPARAGEVISVYGTGFGVTDPARPAGELIEPAPLGSFVARIGEGEATSEFGGLVGPGLYQFNIRVPMNLSGDQALFIETAGITTQAGLTIALR